MEYDNTKIPRATDLTVENYDIFSASRISSASYLSTSPAVSE
jgi:hypothetical protein